jgi:hypothetical protein
MATRKRYSMTRRVSVAAGKMLRGHRARKAFGPVFTVAAAMATTKSRRGKR